MNVPTLSPGKRGYEVVTITIRNSDSFTGCACSASSRRRVSRMPASFPGSDAAAAQQEPPRRDERLDQHGRRHLRLPLTALDEDDRHLPDPAAVARRLEEHLDE